MHLLISLEAINSPGIGKNMKTNTTVQFVGIYILFRFYAWIDSTSTLEVIVKFVSKRFAGFTARGVDL